MLSSEGGQRSNGRDVGDILIERRSRRGHVVSGHQIAPLLYQCHGGKGGGRPIVCKHSSCVCSGCAVMYHMPLCRGMYILIAWRTFMRFTW